MLTDSQLRVVELTVPMNSLSNILVAKERKKQSLFSDILAAGKLSNITYYLRNWIIGPLPSDRCSS